MFPAPETSYTTQSAFGQVVYVPRKIMEKAEAKFKLSRKHLNPTKQAHLPNSLPDNQGDEGETGSASDLVQPADELEADQKAYSEKAQANLESLKTA